MKSFFTIFLLTPDSLLAYNSTVKHLETKILLRDAEVSLLILMQRFESLLKLDADPFRQN